MNLFNNQGLFSWWSFSFFSWPWCLTKARVIQQEESRCQSLSSLLERRHCANKMFYWPIKHNDSYERSANPPLPRRRADHLWRAQFEYSRSFSALFYSVPLLNLTLLADKHLCSHYLFVCGYNKNVRKNHIPITIENWGFIKSVLYFSGWRQNGTLSRRSS